MKISISSPFPIDSLQGNSVSARRIGTFLQESGYEVSLFHDGYDPDTDLFIALNAWRSAPIIKQFSSRPYRVRSNTVPGTVCPNLVVMMTGSDLYPFDGELKPETLESIRLAERVVVTTKGAVDIVNRKETTVIRKSIVLPTFPDPEDKQSDPIVHGMMVAHLREQKNPFLFLRCLPHLKAAIKVDHYGNASGSHQEQANLYASNRYQWQGPLPREQLLTELSQADFYLNTSYMEGSSNALCEAIALDVPVIASDIPGNVGVVEAEYAGLFESDNPRALAELLDRFASSADFRQELQAQCQDIKTTLDPKREKKLWAELVESFK